MAVLLALGAALLYGTGSVLQQRAAAARPDSDALRLRLVTRLLRDGQWRLGIALDLAAFGFEAAALHEGSVVVVGPLLTTGLLFALWMSTRGARDRALRREWPTAMVLVAGLAIFELVGHPGNGSADSSGTGWVVVLVLASIGIAVLVAAAGHAVSSTRAHRLGLATGLLYGLTGPLLKRTVDLAVAEHLHALTHWEPYALLLGSAVAIVVNQTAFQAGHLVASLPAISATTPLVACIVGVVALHEHLAAHGVLAWVLVTASAVAVILAVRALARAAPELETLTSV